MLSFQLIADLNDSFIFIVYHLVLVLSELQELVKLLIESFFNFYDYVLHNNNLVDLCVVTEQLKA